MNSPDYRATQTDSLRSKHDGSELLLRMRNDMENLTSDDIACYIKWWLTTATEHNHTELVNLVLADESLDLNDTVKFQSIGGERKGSGCDFGKPLYLAIENGNLCLIRTFLRAGASVVNNDFSSKNEYKAFDRAERVHSTPTIKDISRHLSAVEYACVVNQPKALKVILSHFNGPDIHPSDSTTYIWRKSVRACKAYGYYSRRDASLTSHVAHHCSQWINTNEAVVSSITRERNKSLSTHSLHVLVRLATEFGEPTLDQLPSFLQLIIDAGGDGNSIDKYGFSPLQLFFPTIRLIFSPSKVGAEYTRVIVETAKMLLNAGAKSNDTRIFRTPLRQVARLLFPFNCIMIRRELAKNQTHVSVACAIRDRFLLVADLTRLLLLHGADLMSFEFYKLVPMAAAKMLRDRQLFVSQRVDCASVCDEIMNALSDIFRLALLAGANRITNEHWNQFIRHFDFVESFIEIANYSSQPDRSEKLINMLLNAFDANNIRKLLDMLLAKREASREARSSSEHRINTAIGYVTAIAVPRCLTFITRHAIHRAMSTKALLSETGVDLGLPAALQAFVLFQ